MNKTLFFLALCSLIGGGCVFFSKKDSAVLSEKVSPSGVLLAASALTPENSDRILMLLEHLPPEEGGRESPVRGIVNCDRKRDDTEPTCYLRRELKVNSYSTAVALNENLHEDLLDAVRKYGQEYATKGAWLADITCFRNGKDEAPFDRDFEQCGLTALRHPKDYVLAGELAGELARLLRGEKAIAAQGLEENQGSLLCSWAVEGYHCQLRPLTSAAAVGVFMLDAEQNELFTLLVEKTLTTATLPGAGLAAMNLEKFPMQLLSELHCFVDGQLFHKDRGENYAFCLGRML